MKRLLAALAALLLAPALALGEAPPLSVGVSELVSGESRVAIFYAQASPDAGEAALAAAAKVNALIEERFLQTRAAAAFAQASGRGSAAILQEESVYQTGEIASIGLLWQGRQSDGSDGCSARALNVSLVTGEELTFDDLFADADAAARAMEEIIERDVLPETSEYMAFASLTPLPRDCFWFDESGLTVGYPAGRYRALSGRAGTTHFAWHEIEGFIPEDSPVYALSRPQDPDALAVRAALEAGGFGAGLSATVGEPLGEALSGLTLLREPDYARDEAAGGAVRLYLFEESALRGYALETPRYADTAETDTPVSGVRASRVSWHGLTTGVTAREEIVYLLGEPDETLAYDEDAARDAMLPPGESLIYKGGGAKLCAHVGEDGVLAALAIRADN